MPINKLGLSMLSFAVQNEPEPLLTLSEHLPKVRAAGFEVVEAAVNPKWCNVNTAETFAARAREAGLYIQSGHLPKLLLHDPLDVALTRLEHCLDLAEAMGKPVMVLHAPYADLGPAIPPIADLLDRVLPDLERRHMILSIENVPWVNDLDEFYGFFLMNYPSPSVGFTLDTEFAHVTGRNACELLTRYGKHIVNMHVKDSRGSLAEEGKRVYLLPGEGHIDWHGLSVAVVQHYAGGLILEAALGPKVDIEMLSRAHQRTSNAIR